MLSTESADVSQVIASKQVAEIPLNGRSWQQLIDLSAGVNPGAPGESGSPNPVNINGQRTKANLYLVDGISTTSSTQGRGNDFNIPLEDVREFSVQAGAYSAEYGNVAGGVINLQSKSGTNKWHGSLFEFFRNNALDAAELFLEPNRPAQECAALQPIRRIDGRAHPAQQDLLLRRLPGHRHSQRPTHGDQRAAEQPARRAISPRCSGRAAPSFTIRWVLRSRARRFRTTSSRPACWIPAAVKITSLLPQPNQFDSFGNPLAFNNYAVTRVDTSNVQSFDVRVDHQFSAKNNALCARIVPEYRRVWSLLYLGLPLGGTIEGAGPTSRAQSKRGPRLHLHNQPHIAERSPDRLESANRGRSRRRITAKIFRSNLAFRAST